MMFKEREALKPMFFLGIKGAHLKKKKGTLSPHRSMLLAYCRRQKKLGCKLADTSIDPIHKLGEVSEHAVVNKGFTRDWLAS